MHTCERSLVEQYQGRPFVVLGVNGDQDRRMLQLVRDEEKPSWRSVWDGPGGPNGQRWGVECYPTLFLLDQHGVIRFKSVGAPSRQVLEQWINTLLKETS